MFDVRYSAQFKKDYRLMRKRRLPMKELLETVDLLRRGEELPRKCRDHELTGIWTGFRECHIRPDWLLIYRIESDSLELVLVRTGRHSELFGK